MTGHILTAETLTNQEKRVIKLNPEFKEKWIKALRSGEFRQCQFTMRKRSETGRSSFCCLGVGAEVYNREHDNCHWDFDVLRDNEDQSLAIGSTWMHGLAAHVGIQNGSLVCVKVDGKIMSLAQCNDDLGLNFDQIADLIEEQL